MLAEVNFDGLPGPTHNYSGLSSGNLSSTQNKSLTSNPREAALQGLAKMKFFMDLGLTQGIFPPQERPDLWTLRKLGFRGTDAEVLAQASKDSPAILAAVSSSSSMWAANAGTVSPSADTEDGKVHFTPANLSSKFHRSIEIETTSRILKRIFKDPKYFTHHTSLPAGNFFSDEGAANHTRLCSSYVQRGLELFVYGRTALEAGRPEPTKYPARQTIEASAAIARNHGLQSNAVVFAQQNPMAIDAGVFHNDVISVGNRNVFFYHEQAFLYPDRVMNELKQKYLAITGNQAQMVCVRTDEVSLTDVVKSYLFNSQLITIRENEMMLVTPSECRETPSVDRYLERLIAEGSSPIKSIHTFDLRQSMQNGGGPACLRFRVVLTPAELAAVHPRALLTPALYSSLHRWVEKHYRDRMTPADIKDPALLTESRAALDELTQILDLGSLYAFQSVGGP